MRSQLIMGYDGENGDRWGLLEGKQWWYGFVSLSKVGHDVIIGF